MRSFECLRVGKGRRGVSGPLVKKDRRRAQQEEEEEGE